MASIKLAPKVETGKREKQSWNDTNRLRSRLHSGNWHIHGITISKSKIMSLSKEETIECFATRCKLLPFVN